MAMFALNVTPRPSSNRAMAFGSAKRPNGKTLTVDGTSLRRDGARWLPSMGEFHFARYPKEEWRDELLKMQAGGIAIVATYIFWIHHEELRGRWDWSGRRDLRAFVELCRELDFPIVLRVGPWCHGEARNGGLPDWVLDCTSKPRSDDATYLAEVRRLYGQIAQQVKGLWWRDGGPIVGVQIENEYGGPAEHLLKLKRIACEAGMDAPFYTRTGWPELTTPMPYGELLPLHGGYAEGFWDRTLDSMPGQYWREFVFRPPGDNATIATDIFGNRDRAENSGDEAYPYLTCELGGGMMSSYHRRLRMSARDVTSIAMVKVGSGSNLPGYYMYHGGTNPESTGGGWLSEAQASRHTNHNDLPVKTYDFQAPLGEFGQVRESYHGLRQLHLFLRDFGAELANMPAAFPAETPTQKHDVSTLRWSVRSSGKAGFLFVNNYQRGGSMPAKPGVQFELGLSGAARQLLPERPVTVPQDTTFFWPFNLPLGPGATLAHATAQPICRLIEQGYVTYVFAEIQDIAAEFAISLKGAAVISPRGPGVSDQNIVLLKVSAALSPAAELRLSDGTICRLILLEGAASLRCWKGQFGGIERVILSGADIVFDHDQIRLRSGSPSGSQPLWMLPAPSAVRTDGTSIAACPEGAFGRFDLPCDQPGRSRPAQTEMIRAAGEPREIDKGAAGVAEAPADAAFDNAATWRITLPTLDPARRPILRLRYIGDVARIYAGNRLLCDNFYNGQPFEFGLWRVPADCGSELLLKVLPLQNSSLIAFPVELPRPLESGAQLLAAECVDSAELHVSV